MFINTLTCRGHMAYNPGNRLFVMMSISGLKVQGKPKQRSLICMLNLFLTVST